MLMNRGDAAAKCDVRGANACMHRGALWRGCARGRHRGYYVWTALWWAPVHGRYRGGAHELQDGGRVKSAMRAHAMHCRLTIVACITG